MFNALLISIWIDSLFVTQSAGKLFEFGNTSIRELSSPTAKGVSIDTAFLLDAFNNSDILSSYISVTIVEEYVSVPLYQWYSSGYTNSVIYSGSDAIIALRNSAIKYIETILIPNIFKTFFIFL